VNRCRMCRRERNRQRLQRCRRGVLRTCRCWLRGSLWHRDGEQRRRSGPPWPRRRRLHRCQRAAAPRRTPALLTGSCDRPHLAVAERASGRDRGPRYPHRSRTTRISDTSSR